jgi:hypothetical protein
LTSMQNGQSGATAMLSDKQLERVFADPVFQQILGLVGGEVPALDEADQTKVSLAFWRLLQNSLSWDTTCLNCSRLLDSCYDADMRREQAEAALSEVVESLEEITGKSLENWLTARLPWLFDGKRTPSGPGE